MFKLSPYQYHSMNPRARMAAALSGLAGTNNAVQVGAENAPMTQLVPTSSIKTLVSSTLMAPQVGSGLIPSRVQVAPSPGRLDMRTYSVLNPPRTELMNSPARYESDVMRLAGLSGLGVVPRGVTGPRAAALTAMDSRAATAVARAAAILPNVTTGVEDLLATIRKHWEGYAIEPLPTEGDAPYVELDKAKTQKRLIEADMAVLSRTCSQGTDSSPQACSMLSTLRGRLADLDARIHALEWLIRGLPAARAAVKAANRKAEMLLSRRGVPSTGPKGVPPGWCNPGESDADCLERYQRASGYATYSTQVQKTPGAKKDIPRPGEDMPQPKTETSDGGGGGGGSGGGSYTETPPAIPTLDAEVYMGAQNVIPVDTGVPTWLKVTGVALLVGATWWVTRK